MGTPVDVVTVLGATVISVGGNRLPTQSFIGDWEGHLGATGSSPESPRWPPSQRFVSTQH
jgi:hypothetical protein